VDFYQDFRRAIPLISSFLAHKEEFLYGFSVKGQFHSTYLFGKQLLRISMKSFKIKGLVTG
jgi:hypothetical protein